MDDLGLQLDPEELKRNLAITLGTQAPQLNALRHPAAAPGPVSLPQGQAPDLAISHPQIKAPRGTVQGDQAERSRMLSTGAGVDQIYGKVTGSDFGQAHPVIGKILGGLGEGLAKAGDIGLSAVAPTIAMNLPGTEMHHGLQLRQINRQIGDEEGEQEKEAQTQHEQAATDTLRNPPDKYTPLSTDQGEVSYDPKTGQVTPIIMNGNPLGSPDKKAAPMLHETDQGLMLVDPDTKQVTPLTLNGKPLMPKPPAAVNAKEQVQRELIDAENRGDKATVQKLQQQLKDMDPMGQQRLDLTIRGQDVAAGARDTKADAATRQAAFKAFQPSLDSGERFNVMAKNYEDAIKSHDQQAMLSLLANHLGMTMGLQKGSRLTRDIIREAEQSRPELQGIMAKFDKDGLLSGVTLTPAQMQQMVDLGRGRFTEDTTKSRSEARYLGSSDDGPDRVPNQATMRFYLAQTHGDVAKAKQLATDDGWTVK